VGFINLERHAALTAGGVKRLRQRASTATRLQARKKSAGLGSSRVAPAAAPESAGCGDRGRAPTAAARGAPTLNSGIRGLWVEQACGARPHPAAWRARARPNSNGRSVSAVTQALASVAGYLPGEHTSGTLAL
jgi:hypothetical protein